MRVRGLKLVTGNAGYERISVAPHAGAWIETGFVKYNCHRGLSHPMRVRGLKQPR